VIHQDAIHKVAARHGSAAKRSGLVRPRGEKSENSAGALEKHVRDIDLLARLGGDEFVIGLSHADALVGEHVYNRIRAQVAAVDFGGREGPRGVSGGIASSSTTPAPDLRDAADRALYQAKGLGGNTSQTWHGGLPD